MLQKSNRVEFISILNDKMEKEIVAFLNNREGGVLYIGLDDDGHPLMNKDLDATQIKIAERIKNNILPSAKGLFDIVTEIIDNVSVIKIIVSSGLEKPYYIKSQGMSPTGCFTRVGTSTQPMTTAMIDDLCAKRNHTTLRNILSPRQDLTFSQLKIYYQERGFELNSNFANDLELYTPDGKYNYVAYLLADENAVSIKVAKYAGTDKVDLIENDEYGYCSLIKATNNVLDKLKIENITLTKVTSTTRIKKKLVNPVALREAVINAIVHNDFTMEIPPVFEIFSNRITITSYGGLIPGQSIDDFFSCSSMPRNRELMRVFKDVGLAEQPGSGMSRILNAYHKDIFEISEHSIKVIFPIADVQGKFIIDNDDINGDAENEGYIRESESDKRNKRYAWHTAIGLQAVDGLKTSEYLLRIAGRNIKGEISFKEANELLQIYYEENPAHEVKDRTEEADMVSVRIAELLTEQAFSFTPNEYISIHRKLFIGIYPLAGRIRDYNITKKEWVLDGATVIYGSATELRATLDYDFSEEKKFSYRNLSMDEIIHHLALFISSLWQIHVFGEGNTRTTAVFFIKYLRTLGFDVTNDIFAENAWYFRNSLVRANYNDLKNGIYETTEYLELFLRNLLLNEHHPLYNRTLRIR